MTDDLPSIDDYYSNSAGFVMYLHDLADYLFPFPSYRDGQGEALYEAVESLYVNGYENVILDLPTGVGKSPLNVTVARVGGVLAAKRNAIEDHFSVRLSLNRGAAFIRRHRSSSATSWPKTTT